MHIGGFIVQEITALISTPVLNVSVVYFIRQRRIIWEGGIVKYLHLRRWVFKLFSLFTLSTT